jgi:Xaa-Pro aminopeptidase
LILWSREAEVGATPFLEARYVANQQGSVILPREGDPILIAPGQLARTDGWIADVRPATEDATTAVAMGAAVARVLKGLNLGRKRVAVAGLCGGGPYTMVRQPEGHLNHSTFVQAVSAIPQAEIVDGSRIIGEARYVKSDEEIMYLRASEELAEEQVQVMLDVARAGVPFPKVYAAMTALVQERGFEVGRQHLGIHTWGSVPQRSGETGLAPMVTLESGWIIKGELEPSVGGYTAQIDQPVLLGEPTAEQREVFELGKQAFSIACAEMKSGAIWRQVWSRIHELNSASYRAEFLLHGRGMSDEGPLYIPAGDIDKHASNDDPIRENTVFVLKPFAYRVGDPRNDWENGRTFVWGDSVLVTASGAVRLGSRPHELCSPAYEKGAV